MKVLRITARREGFRRAGLAHPARPVLHPVDRFTEGELAALKAEGWLLVEEIEVEDPQDPPPAEGAGRKKKG